jgi:hypothetical protein
MYMYSLIISRTTLCHQRKSAAGLERLHELRRPAVRLHVQCCLHASTAPSNKGILSALLLCDMSACHYGVSWALRVWQQCRSQHRTTAPLALPAEAAAAACPNTECASTASKHAANAIPSIVRFDVILLRYVCTQMILHLPIGSGRMSSAHKGRHQMQVVG